MNGFNINCKNCAWCVKRINRITKKTVWYCRRPRVLHDIEQNIDCLGFEDRKIIEDDL